MDTSRQPATASPSTTQDSAPAKRQRWTIKQKRQIVEETLVPGTSVARVARSHGVNANQVFHWRKQHLAGRLGNSSTAIKLLPVTLGVLYYRERRWAESAAMTRKALDINGKPWRAWTNLRLAYEWLNRKSEADEALRMELARLEEIVDVSADDADVQVQLGLLYSKLKLRERALPRVEAALALPPEDPSVFVTAAEAYDNLGNRTRALELVQQALTKGWTLTDLENDPGQQSLLRDPRFLRIARQFKNNSGLLSSNPDEAGPPR